MITEKLAAPLLPGIASTVSRTDRVRRWVDLNLALVFNLPTVACLAALIVFPVGLVLWTSLTDWQLVTNQQPAFVGLSNYVEVWTDERWLHGILNTFYFASCSVLGQLILGLATAMLFNRQFAGKAFYRSIWMMPMISMSVAISLVWAILFNNTYGLLNHVFTSVGLPAIEWITSPAWVMPSLIIVGIWQHTPFMTLLLLAGLQSLPSDPFEAAHIDGASKWQILVNITLPLLKGHIIVALILRSIFAMKEFDTIMAITEGGPSYASETMNMNIYFNAFEYGYMGASSAKGVLFFTFILLIQLALIKLRRRQWSY